MGQKEDFAARLMQLREEAGMSRRSLARKIRVTHASIWHWETGSVLPRQQNLEALARVFDVAPDFLRFGPGYDEGLGQEIMQAQQRIAERAGLAPSKVRILLDD